MTEQTPKRRTSTLNISLNEISEATKKSMFVRIVSSIILAVMLVPALFLGGWYFIGLVFIASIIAVYEILRGVKIARKYWYIYFLAFIATLSLTFWIFVKNNIVANSGYGYAWWDITKWVVEEGFSSIEVSSFLLATILLSIFVLLVFDKNFNFNIAAYLFLLILLAGFGFQAILFLRLYPEFSANSVLYPSFKPTRVTSSFLMVFVILGTIMNDIGAYFIGVLFGKTKMIERISPNKTWEGFVGGLFFSVLFSFFFAMIVSWLKVPILPFLTHTEWYYILLLSLVMPLAATIGDLFFSATKRHLDIKDYGHVIVGHGGVLDRIDSLLLVSVTISLLIILINNGWNLLA